MLTIRLKSATTTARARLPLANSAGLLQLSHADFDKRAKNIKIAIILLQLPISLLVLFCSVFIIFKNLILFKINEFKEDQSQRISVLNSFM
jgi:hypothetical protein